MNFSNIEKLRKMITSTLSAAFDDIYVVRDDISKKICSECYSHINSVENYLREFILKFMITKIGSEWFKYVVTDSGINKANSRNIKDKEIPFILDDIYNIDFKDLSDIIFKNHTHYKSKSDILNELRKCNTLEDFEWVREKSESNWESYFNQFFQENWKEKWNKLSEYRNIIAHNKIISSKTERELKELSDDISHKIKDAIVKLNDFHYSNDEKINIGEKVVRITNDRLKASIAYINMLGYEIEKIKNIIDSFQDDYITVKDVVKTLTGSYIVNESINKYVGVILVFLSDEFCIERKGGISVIDDNGLKTTCIKYQKI